ncbi:hypothetical protein OAM67_01735 [bacterium]|nr:hypothetical protein [bacterium]
MIRRDHYQPSISNSQTPLQHTENPVTQVVFWTKDPATIVSRVETYLRAKLKELHPTSPFKLGVCFDIDETLFTLQKDEARSREFIQVNPVGRAVFKLCKTLGFYITLITARVGDRSSLKYVQDQLSAAGYNNFHNLFMISRQHKSDDSPALCKLKSRVDISKKRPIVLNIGNKLTDFFVVDDEDEDIVLSRINPNTYYILTGQSPDIACLKLPDC